MPLFLPLALETVGALVGYLALSSYRRSKPNSVTMLVALLTVAIAAAVTPNIGQQFFDMGMSFPTIQVLGSVSYFIFAFATAGAWAVLRSSKRRWALLALVPVSLAHPFLWTFAHIAWTINGFAP
jgi:hypothetical protein